MNKSGTVHSVSQKLLNVAKAKDVDYNIVLIWYGLERFLYRLSKSTYSDKFILKGAMLFSVWAQQPLRPTKDLDLMASGEPSADYLRKALIEICQTKADNDIVFNTKDVRIDPIRIDQEYKGLRVKLPAKLGNAKIRLQIDIGFGDIVTPAPVKIKYPVLLEAPVPIIKAYPKETVVAEKVQAMVSLGYANSRMKDFYDLWIMSKQFDFDGPLLTKAIAATFQKRKTTLPQDLPPALTDDFSSDTVTSQRWKAFANKLGQSSHIPPLNEVVHELKDFLMMPLEHAKKNSPFNKKWLNNRWD